MTIRFFKYQGAGNDFVVLDNREEKYTLSPSQIEQLCDRRFGVGADGLLLLELLEGYDFRMIYYNSDGKKAEMCGNGGRCLVAFAKYLKIIQERARFLAEDGIHEAIIQPNGIVELKMQDVNGILRSADTAVLNTGVPHYVKYVNNLDKINVQEEGRKIRYSSDYAREGINVNFMEYAPSGLSIRTYERGVEDETMACGTGVTAAAIAASGNRNQTYTIPVKARGGSLEVRYDKTGEQHFQNIWLCGPASLVFEGEITLQ